eukprot:g3015.t1
MPAKRRGNRSKTPKRTKTGNRKKTPKRKQKLRKKQTTPKKKKTKTASVAQNLVVAAEKGCSTRKTSSKSGKKKKAQPPSKYVAPSEDQVKGKVKSVACVRAKSGTVQTTPQTVNKKLLLYPPKEVNSVVSCGPVTCGVGPFVCGRMSHGQCLCINGESSNRITLLMEACCIYRERICCYEMRSAFPPTIDIPLQLGICGLMCCGDTNLSKKDRLQYMNACCCVSCGCISDPSANICSETHESECFCFKSYNRCELISGERVPTLCDAHCQHCCMDLHMFCPCGNDGTVWKFGAGSSVIWSTDKPMWTTLMVVGCCALSAMSNVFYSPD